MTKEIQGRYKVLLLLLITAGRVGLLFKKKIVIISKGPRLFGTLEYCSIVIISFILNISKNVFTVFTIILLSQPVN